MQFRNRTNAATKATVVAPLISTLDIKDPLRPTPTANTAIKIVAPSPQPPVSQPNQKPRLEGFQRAGWLDGTAEGSAALSLTPILGESLGTAADLTRRATIGQGQRTVMSECVSMIYIYVITVCRLGLWIEG